MTDPTAPQRRHRPDPLTTGEQPASIAQGRGTFATFEQALAAAVAAYWRNRPDRQGAARRATR